MKGRVGLAPDLDLHDNRGTGVNTATCGNQSFFIADD